MILSNMKKWETVLNLLAKVSDPLFHSYFDIDSEELLDEKIEVLTALAGGKTPAEIPKYYDVLELKPKDDQHWDM